MADYATLLRDHTTLTCRSIDRIFLQGYVAQLQSPGQLALFLMNQRGFRFPSSAALGVIGEKYAADIKGWAQTEGVPIRYFKKGENKEAIAKPLLEAAAREGGEGRVVLLGIAQEKASAWRSWKAKGQEHASRPRMEWGRQMTYVNHFYAYLWDPDWGKAFWKTNAYCPFPVWLWLNGHEWAKRQLEREGVEYQALDNGFRACADPVALQRICDRLGRVRWRTSSGAGSGGCHRPSRRTTFELAMSTTSPCGSSRSRTPASSTAPRPGAPSSRA